MFNNNVGGLLTKSAGTGAASIASNVAYVHTGATIDIQSGSFGITGAALTLDAGSVLQGADGTTYTGDVNNNAGTVRPGGNGGTGIFTINGNYSQLASGTLDIELQGTTAGTGYDQLAVTGNATLAGNLTISEINGFSAVALDSFTYLTTSAISGDFTGKRIFPIGYALPVATATQQSIGFNDGTTVYFDNFSGDASWNNASNWSSGLVPVNNLDIDLATLNSASVMINSGSFTVNSIIAPASLIHNGGSLTVTGDANITGTYEQNGTSSSTQFAGTASAALFDNNAGTLIINGVATGDVQNDGTLSGNGTINGDVVSNGILNPGTSPGILTINGNLSLLSNSLLNLDVSSRTTPGTDFDLLAVSGNVSFGGTLAIITPEGAPALRVLDAISPITYSSSNGQFSTVTASTGYAFNTLYEAAAFRLEISAVPGSVDQLGDGGFNPVVSQLVILGGQGNILDALNSAFDEEEEGEGSGHLVCT